MDTTFFPVILAGGSGTRFWPRSRRTRAKQVLALDGERTMIQQTIDRLSALAPQENFWIITNEYLHDVIAEQLPDVPEAQIVAEPAARNTAPAIGLAAFILEKRSPNAVLALFPSDQVVADEAAFRRSVRTAIEIARSGEKVVVMGVPPTRPETGYGYIEAGAAVEGSGDVARVQRFREKPDLETAKQFVASGKFYWNGGMFVWSARTVVKLVREHLPKTAERLEKIAEAFGTAEFGKTLAEHYGECDNISIDYGVMEPLSAKGEASGIYVVRADFGWNDLGSWTALYEHRAARNGASADGENIVEAAAHFALNADGNYVYAPKKFVATVGVSGVVVVETEDAILVTTREHAQDVGKVVKYLSEQNITSLL
jgi:mannose-1-phosphate guanylyltransferase